MSGRLSFAVRAAVTLALLALLFAHADLAAVAGTLATVDLPLLVAAFAIQCLVMPLSALRWQLLLRRLGHAASVLQLTRITWIATFFGMFLPATAGHDLVRGRLLYSRGIPVADLFSSILVDRLFGTVALMAMCLPALLLLLPANPAFRPALWTIAALLALAALTAALAGPALTLVRRIALPTALRRMADAVTKVVGGCRPVLRDAKLVIAAAALSLAIHLLIVLTVYLLGRSSGLALGFASYLMIVPLVFLMATLPVSLGGLGVREAGFVLLFGQAGIAGEQALTLALLLLAILLGSSAIGGLLYLAADTAARDGGAPLTSDPMNQRSTCERRS